MSRPLIEHWDGNSWTPVSDAPILPGTDLRLLGVEASSPTDVWAVGTGITQAAATTPFAIHFDGTSWVPVNLPMPKAPAGLTSAEAPPTGPIWLAGGLNLQPYSEHACPIVANDTGYAPASR